MNKPITGVAVLTRAGVMVALPEPHRHHHIFALAALLGVDLENGVQGFVTKYGSFVNRKVALEFVIEHGQPNRRSGSADSKELFSEDVW